MLSGPVCLSLMKAIYGLYLLLSSCQLSGLLFAEQESGTLSQLGTLNFVKTRN